MRLVDNLDMHTILDELRFLLYPTFRFGGTCPFMPHIRPCPECSLFSFNRNIMKLADNLERDKI